MHVLSLKRINHCDRLNDLLIELGNEDFSRSNNWFCLLIPFVRTGRRGKDRRLGEKIGRKCLGEGIYKVSPEQSEEHSGNRELMKTEIGRSKGNIKKLFKKCAIQNMVFELPDDSHLICLFKHVFFVFFP